MKGDRWKPPVRRRVRSSRPVSGERLHDRSGRVLPGRDGSSGRVDYRLLVRVKGGLPAGYFNDKLILVTNDRRASQVPIHVEGNVIPGLTVSPASLFLGVIKPGQKVTKTLIVKGKEPFKITRVSCEDSCFEFKPSDEKKPLHIVRVVFVPEKLGKITQNIQIETDLGSGEIAACIASATIVN